MTTASNDDKKVIGVVLAGGRSSRMGTDKALLRIKSCSMIQRSAAMLKEAGINEVVVSRNDNLPQHIGDIIANKGPLSGIHSAAFRYPRYNLMILPVDLPLINARTIKELVETGSHRYENVRYKNDSLPLFINNTSRFRQVIDYTLKCTESFSVKQLCSHFPLFEINQKEPSTLFNTNTPQQWRFAVQHIADNQFDYIREHV
jgi:molybdopterin-guanine dinucleotide biosynthesis protein A